MSKLIVQLLIMKRYRFITGQAQMEDVIVELFRFTQPIKLKFIMIMNATLLSV